MGRLEENMDKTEWTRTLPVRIGDFYFAEVLLCVVFFYLLVLVRVTILTHRYWLLNSGRTRSGYAETDREGEPEAGETELAWTRGMSRRGRYD